jgi:hypothetical protein
LFGVLPEWLVLVAHFGGFFVGLIVVITMGGIAWRQVTALVARSGAEWAVEEQRQRRYSAQLSKYFAQMKKLKIGTDAPDSAKQQARELTLSVLPKLHGEGKWKVL